jgi:hypothetical protein
VSAGYRDKGMAHFVESPAVDVFSLPSPFLTNSTVVLLSASSRSLVLSGGCVCVGGDRGVSEGENIRGPATDEASGARLSLAGYIPN